MLIFETKSDLRLHLEMLNAKNNTIGLVPTMGALHDGHISLVKKAFAENTAVVVSIFVNPTQFNNEDDLKQYPKTLENDIALLSALSDEIVVFAPSVAEIYSNTIVSRSYDFDGLDKVMEGAYREGHFNGVGTIVEELLTLVRPDRAYFGEKDFQQLQIIRKLIKNRQIPVEIIGCPIVRERNGLAMSSRNERLSKVLRTKASFIYQTLKSAKVKFGTKSAKYVMKWVENQFRKNPDLELEYIQITEVDTLNPVLRKHKNKKYRAFIAVYADGVRLIDNIALN